MHWTLGLAIRQPCRQKPSNGAVTPVGVAFKTVAGVSIGFGKLRDDLDRARGEALLDPLTGILNRKGFDQKLRALLHEPQAGPSHCLVMLDIDHFKNVNDTLGHVPSGPAGQRRDPQGLLGAPHFTAQCGVACHEVCDPAPTVLAQLPAAFEHFNEVHPHSSLRM